MPNGRGIRSPKLQMKERPILFSSEMVQAILEGRKTQTRRIIKPQPPMGHWYSGSSGMFVRKQPLRHHWYEGSFGNNEWGLKCPYGTVDDRLWVRETFSKHPKGGYYYKATDILPDTIEYSCRWKSPIHMPRAASRITLEITDIMVKRVQDITDDDARAEGCTKELARIFAGEDENNDPDSGLEFAYAISPKFLFQHLWETINAKRGYGWDTNPWVWIVKFNRR